LNKSLEKGSNENCHINYGSVWDPVAVGSTVALWPPMEVVSASRHPPRSRCLENHTRGKGIRAAKSKPVAMSLRDGAMLAVEQSGHLPQKYCSPVL